jgi:membrane associated rhomboid family serine protease
MDSFWRNHVLHSPSNNKLIKIPMFLPLHDKNPLTIVAFQFVTLMTIVLSIGVFLWQKSLSGEAAVYASYAYGLLPSVFLHQQSLPPEVHALPTLLTLVSYMFLHGSWVHLLGNMLFLWVFGDNIEDAMGHFRFIIFYLICGMAAGLTHTLLEPASEMPMIGASGAIAGLLGAYLMLHPRVKVLVLLLGRIPVYLPAYLLLIAWIIFQFYSATSLTEENTVAWWAHIGGFITGMVLIIPMKYRQVKLLDHPVEEQ